MEPISLLIRGKENVHTDFHPKCLEIVLLKTSATVSILEPAVNGVLGHVVTCNVLADGLSDQLVLV